MVMVSWDGEKKFPCPCGRGHYRVRWQEYSSFPGVSRSEYDMLCPVCKRLYAYDSTIVWSQPGNQRERGWVLETTLAEEAAYRQRRSEYHAKVIVVAERRFRSRWQAKVQE